MANNNMYMYTSSSPTLPALASGEDDHPAAGIAKGTPLNSNDAEAARRQAKSRATPGEVHAAEKSLVLCPS